MKGKIIHITSCADGDGDTVLHALTDEGFVYRWGEYNECWVEKSLKTMHD